MCRGGGVPAGSGGQRPKYQPHPRCWTPKPRGIEKKKSPKPQILCRSPEAVTFPSNGHITLYYQPPAYPSSLGGISGWNIGRRGQAPPNRSEGGDRTPQRGAGTQQKSQTVLPKSANPGEETAPKATPKSRGKLLPCFLRYESTRLIRGHQNGGRVTLHTQKHRRERRLSNI